MNRFIPILVLGSLAFTLASKPLKVGGSELGGASLSAGFPPGKVPVDPKSVDVTGGSPALGFSEFKSQFNQRIVTQIPHQSQPYLLKASGKIYKYQVPLDDENAEDHVEGPYAKELLEIKHGGLGHKYYKKPNFIKSPSDNQYTQLPGNRYDQNNGKEGTSEDLTEEKTDYNLPKAKAVINQDFSSIQDLQFEKSKKKYSRPVGNQSHALQEAGSGYHNDVAVVAQPQLLYEEQEGLDGDGIGGGDHEITGHEVDYGHDPVHDHHDLVPQHKSYSKPLKPSVVHRDPHDSFDHHDKVRTYDKDHLLDHNQVKQGFQPYVYDMYKVPECAYKNKDYYNLTFCLEDHEYPLESILWAIHDAGLKAHQLLSDVTYQSADNLVTGLTRDEEEGYTYKHYFGGTHSQHTHLEQYKPPYQGYTYKTDYFKKGGYICPSDIYYGRPKRAMNTYGKWKVIVNVDHIPKGHYEHGNTIQKRGITYDHVKGQDIYQKPYTQTLRLEQCIYPNAPCSYIDSHYHSSCIQKHNFVRLVSWTHEEGLHVETFKMPIACSCHIRQPIHFYHQSGHHVETHGHGAPPSHIYDHHHNQKK